MSNWTALKLAAWLGPWAGTAAPRDVERSEVWLRPDPPYRAFCYRPVRTRPRGTYVVVQGLHFLGPADPRMDRMCRVLAGCGLQVVAPFLPAHLSLVIAPTAVDDLGLAFEHAEALAREAGNPRPAVFSISFGSQPAIALCASTAYRDRVGGLVLFGGFADFDATVRFCITGRARREEQVVELARDPLNSPVVYLNLLEHLDVRCDRAVVARAFREMVFRTWGRMELKAEGARDPIAHDIAGRLGRAERELFLVACGLAGGGLELLEEGLARSSGAFRFADPRLDLGQLNVPVAIVHGRDDDVIPFLEAEKIRRALPGKLPARVLLTGFYGHSNAELPGVRALAAEVRTLLAVVQAMAGAPAGRLA